MPAALALLREILRSTLPADERRWLVLDADFVLGLDLHHAWDLPRAGALGDASPEPAPIADEARVLLAHRTAARAAHEYARADQLREALAAMGWDVVDEPAGSRLERKGARR